MKAASFTLVALLLFACAGTANALTLTRGVATPLSAVYGTLELTCSTDQPRLAEALVAPGTLDSDLDIPVNRVQYDIHHTVRNVGQMDSFTIFYDESIGPKIISAATPISYIDPSGTLHVVGGIAYSTLLNNGYGIYTYNTGAAWGIDYHPTFITFFRLDNADALPYDAAVGMTDVGDALPSFSIEFDRSLGFGDVNGEAQPDDAAGPLSGVIIGPVVPEPSSLIGLAAPILGLGVLRRRRWSRR